MNTLALKDRYTSSEIKFLSNAMIIEYDMKRAGLNIIRKYKLLPDKKINKLLDLNNKTNAANPNYGKRMVDIEIGKLQIDNEKLREGLKAGFIESRNLFLTRNNLDETNVLAIKKDAIFVLKQVDFTKIDEYINFRPKNTYTGYLMINRIEMYYHDGELDIKGLGEVDEELHRDSMIKFFIKFFKKSETSSKEEVLKFLRIFLDRYKRLELKPEFYIPFRSGGMYTYKDGITTAVDYRNDKKEYDITYNYKIIIDLVKYVL